MTLRSLMTLCYTGKITLKISCLLQVIIFYTTVNVTFNLYGKFNETSFLDPSGIVRVQIMAKEKQLGYCSRRSSSGSGKKRNFNFSQCPMECSLWRPSFGFWCLGMPFLCSPFLSCSCCCKRIYETPPGRNIKLSTCLIIFLVRLNGCI